MQSLPRKDKILTKQRLNSHTPKPKCCLSPSNNTKPQTSMQTKQRDGGERVDTIPKDKY